ncbi:uncharacterized protein LOC123310418 [Coccinella septempunctata]|uniref:uncharacterized protein LOC123310418 n=1 Tax=Coccinella septempunctata TaxID=41139 RepID=UPI001D0600CB|nr:uncharacterized protein LOC123310418 [Coccinella septempunctata]
MVSNVTPIVITTAFVALISTGLCVYLVRKKRRENRVPSEWRKVGSARKLFLFPLKSGHYMEIDSAECTEVGLRLLKSNKNPLELRDRSFIVYGEKDSEIKSGRVLPQLVKIEVSVHDGSHIALDAPQMRTLYVKVPEKSDLNTTTVKVWSGETVDAVDCGDEAARWLSHHISQKDDGYRLGFHDASKRRNLVKFQDRMKYYKLMTDAATGLFSDVTSVLVVNQASINDYNKKAPSANVTPLNFRPNIIVDDPDIKPYEEDDWDWMKIGDEVIMRNVKECTRCVFTTVDQETGVRNSDREPLKTLSQYRMSKSPENAPIMGIHMEVKKTGIIRYGDPVYVGVNKTSTMISSKTTVIATTLFVAVSTGICVYVLKRNKRKNKIPTEWKQIGNVKKLYIFPLKSGRFIEIDRADCTEVGFRLIKTEENPLELRDRSFIVYGEKDKEIRSGRALPSLVKVEISVHDEEHIALDAPNMEKILVRIPQRTSSNVTTVKDHNGENIETLDCGDEVAKWLSQQISQQNSGYRLGFHEGLKRRRFVKRVKNADLYENLTDEATGLFSDLTSVMIVNQASVDDCASKVTTNQITPLFFRGNIVVDGPNLKAFDEDNWDWIKVGDVVMRNVKECTRCAFTNVDPETGLRSDQKEPIKTLSSYRMGGKGPQKVPVMGIHMDVKRNGIIKSGDPVYIGCD